MEAAEAKDQKVHRDRPEAVAVSKDHRVIKVMQVVPEQTVHKDSKDSVKSVLRDFRVTKVTQVHRDR